MYHVVVVDHSRNLSVYLYNRVVFALIQFVIFLSIPQAISLIFFSSLCLLWMVRRHWSGGNRSKHQHRVGRRCSPTTLLSSPVPQLRKVLTWRLPHVLTVTTRISICQSLHLHTHRKEYVEDLINGDEIWVLREHSLRRVASWMRGPARTHRNGPSPEKCLLRCFWESLRIELVSHDNVMASNGSSDYLFE